MNEIDKFDLKGNSYECWVNSAENLLLSGHLLDMVATQYEKDDPEKGAAISMNTCSPKLLLFGYSLECFFKAVWRLRNPKNKLAENGEYIGPKIHDLTKLAQLAGLAFTTEEESLLVRLSKVVLSTGRYPIALDWEVTKKEKILNVTATPTWWAIGEDDERFKQIVTKIREEIERLHPEPPVK